MNDFKAKHIKEASKYLQEKLNALKKEEKYNLKLEDKTESAFKKFIKSFFRI